MCRAVTGSLSCEQHHQAPDACTRDIDDKCFRRKASSHLHTVLVEQKMVTVMRSQICFSDWTEYCGIVLTKRKVDFTDC